MEIVKNDEFLNRDFYDKEGKPYSDSNKEIIEKFQSITGIKERRYAEENHNTSDLATFASENAIKSAKINKEDLDYIIVAHNFGEIDFDSSQYIALPSVATLVKHKLAIENPNCVAYDLIFGCPGWVEGVIQSSAYIKAGLAKKCLVIGASDTKILKKIIDYKKQLQIKVNNSSLGT